MTTRLSMIMILLWAMACLSSINTGIPMFFKNVAAEYFCLRLDLSRTAVILTPRFWACIKAWAMGLLVKE